MSPRLLGLLVLLSVSVAQAQGPSVTVSHPWARPTAATVPNGAAYLTLSAAGAGDKLVGVSTPVAAMAELHQTSSDNGVMRMRPVEGGLPITPGTQVVFAPGGYHVMLMGLTHPLAAGETFPMTLTFDKSPPVTVQVLVEGPGAAAPMSHGAMHQ